jgi:hypothetical protein
MTLIERFRKHTGEIPFHGDESRLMESVLTALEAARELARIAKTYSEVAPIGVEGHMLTCSCKKDLLDGGSTDCDCLIGDNIRALWAALTRFEEVMK